MELCFPVPGEFDENRIICYSGPLLVVQPFWNWIFCFLQQHLQSTIVVDYSLPHKHNFCRGMSIKLEELTYFTYFSIIVPSNICVFLSCRSFMVNTTSSTGFVGVEVSSVSWDTNKTCWKCCINNKRPTGKKHTDIGWDNGGKIGKIINLFYL